MTKKTNPKLIGGFVVGAIVLVVAGVMIFGSGKFFAEKHRWVLYFPGSVKGLTVGAPVTLEGVNIGTVTDVKIVFDRETLKFYAPVYVEIFPNRIKDIGEYVAKEAPDTEEVMKALVQRGLRGQLDLQSLVTGKLQVSFSMHPGSEIYYAGIDKSVTEIPTLPTTMQQLAKMLKNIDIKGMTEDIRNTLAAIEKLATSPELAEAVTSLNNTLKDFGKLARNVDGRVGPLTSSIEETMRDTQKLVNNVDAQIDPTFSQLQDTLKTAEAALQKAKMALAGVDDVVGVDSAFIYQLNKTVKELQVMASSINALANYLQRQPDSLIRGKVSLGGK
ncbi:MAG: MlaD family protein [Syntrophobacteria bacterium]